MRAQGLVAMPLGFGERLRHVIRTRGMTQERLELEAGFGKGCVWMWTSGKREPGAESLRRLCRVLHVSADWLLGLTEEP